MLAQDEYPRHWAAEIASLLSLSDSKRRFTLLADGGVAWDLP